MALAVSTSLTIYPRGFLRVFRFYSQQFSVSIKENQKKGEYGLDHTLFNRLSEILNQYKEMDALIKSFSFIEKSLLERQADYEKLSVPTDKKAVFLRRIPLSVLVLAGWGLAFWLLRVWTWGVESIVLIVFGAILISLVPPALAVLDSVIEEKTTRKKALADAKEAREAAEQEYLEVYKRIGTHKVFFDKLVGEIPEDCRCPLIIYIIQSFVKDGKCKNALQGVDMVRKTLIGLENSKDEKEKRLLAEIKEDQNKAKQKEAFLDNLDEMVNKNLST